MAVTLKVFQESYFFSRRKDGDVLELDKGETHHLSRVFRLGIGDIIQITDGEGWLFKSQIMEIHNCLSLCRILEQQHHTRPVPDIHLAAAILKGGSMDELMEMTFPLGVREFTPIKTAFSVKPSRLEERVMERWRHKAVAVLKQAKMTFLTCIRESTTLMDLLEKPGVGKTLILHTQHGVPLWEAVSGNDGHFTLLVGPEGGFSQQEVRLCLDKGAAAVCLGRARLRSELAAHTAVCGVRLLTKSL